jgi:uncharacterized SAM-binding protein YcdF (DUF218 family)
MWWLRALDWPLVVGGSMEGRDAIVVLGTQLADDDSLTRVGRERVVAGVELWRRGVAPRLVMTGGRSRRARHRLPEAVAMGLCAESLGVTPAALTIESRSSTTAENAFACAALLGAARVVVVSQPFHLRRARMWFRRAGFDAVGYAIADSLQYREPGRGLRWVLREYGALGRDLFFRGGSRDRRRR